MKVRYQVVGVRGQLPVHAEASTSKMSLNTLPSRPPPKNRAMDGDKQHDATPPRAGHWPRT